MPHIIVQPSPNVTIRKPAKLLQALNTTLWETGEFGKPQDIKARIVNISDTFIGIDEDQNKLALVAVELRLMSGRSKQVRDELAEKLLTCLQQTLDNQQLDLSIQYTVEVVELSTVYKKVLK